MILYNREQKTISTNAWRPAGQKKKNSWLGKKNIEFFAGDDFLLNLPQRRIAEGIPFSLLAFSWIAAPRMRIS